MKIEFYDIQTQKKAEGFTQELPEGVGLGKIFEYDKDLAGLLKSVTQVTVNGRRVDNWQSYCPAKDDRVNFSIAPGDGLGILTLLSILMKVISIVMFIIGLFQKPKKPQENRPQSPTYSFEGITDTFAPGDPIPVTYGKQRKGGQMLMYYLTMLPDKSGLAMSTLLSLGEGPVDSIDEVEINELKSSVLNSVSILTKLGTSSQSIMTGFEEIKNTFHDGREISDEIRNGRDGGGQTSNLVYRTVGHDVQAAEIFVAALQGLTCIGKHAGTHYTQWSEYQIEYRDSSDGTNECDNIVWQTFGTRRLTGQYERTYWDNFVLNFPYSSRWDIRLTWTNAQCHPKGANPGMFTYRLWLQEVTEMRGQSSAINNEALMAINATPTRDLHGGRPNITALVRGLKPDKYTTVTSFVNQWTQNPAWCAADYMTNSRYGMGAYISKSELDLQSFIDFATLCDSLISTCTLNANTQTAAGNCTGTDGFHTGDPPQGDGGFPLGTSDYINDPYDCVGLWSKTDGQPQYGICLTRMCCPQLDNCWGVFSGDSICEYAEVWFNSISKIDTGSPVFGLVAYVASGSTADNFTGYGAVYHHGSHTMSAVRWNNQAVNTYGTLLLTVPYSWQPYDYFYLAVAPNYTQSGSWDYYNNDDTIIYLYATTSASAVKVDTEFVDTSSLRITKGGCGGIAEQGLNGVVVLSNNASGDFHGAHVEDFSHYCGLCYGSCFYNVNTLAGGFIQRHWDNTCLALNTKFYEDTRFLAIVPRGF